MITSSPFIAFVTVLALAGAAHAQNVIDLELIGPSAPVAVGQTINIQLRARRVPTDNFVGMSFVAIDSVPTLTVAVAIPAGVPPGASIHAMFAGLTQPGVANAYGALTSNGVTTFVNAF